MDIMEAWELGRKVAALRQAADYPAAQLLEQKYRRAREDPENDYYELTLAYTSGYVSD